MEAIRKKLSALKEEKEAAFERAEQAEAEKKELQTQLDCVCRGGGVTLQWEYMYVPDSALI